MSRNDGHYVRLMGSSFESYCDFHNLGLAERVTLADRLEAQLAERQQAAVAKLAARYETLHAAQRAHLDDGAGGA